ncbi:MAG: hypothetical protein L3J13_02850 [Devosiaceae bacterium]|nr:hypothetical protein [Devosiaceae bacterium]
MALQKLAVELDETIRQTRDLVTSINEALNMLMNKEFSDNDARRTATNQIMIGLQAQDRIEQRCANITTAIELLSKCTLEFDEKKCDHAWESLSLDELSKPEMSGISARSPHGEVDLF